MRENKFIAYRDLLYEACGKHFGKVLCVELVGTSCFRVTLESRVIKARIRPKGKSTELFKEAHELVELPPILLETEHGSIPLRFMEWWEGYEFHRLRGNGIPPRYFHKYGEFIGKLNNHGIYTWDAPWNNVIYTPHNDSVIMCDDDAYVDTDRNYNERFLGTIATDDQRKAYYDGYRMWNAA